MHSCEEFAESIPYNANCGKAFFVIIIRTEQCGNAVCNNLAIRNFIRQLLDTALKSS